MFGRRFRFRATSCEIHDRVESRYARLAVCEFSHSEGSDLEVVPTAAQYESYMQKISVAATMNLILLVSVNSGIARSVLVVEELKKLEHCLSVSFGKFRYAPQHDAEFRICQ